MDAAVVEKSIAFVGAIVVGIVALVSLRAEWKLGGLDNNVTKLMLGLLALGCVLVILASVGILGRGGA